MACAFAIGATEHRILALRLHALLEFLLGNLDRARDHYLSVLSLHDPDRHAPLRHSLVHHLLGRQLNLRQFDKSAPLAMAARAIAQRHDFLYWGAWSRLILAIGELQQPNAASSEDLIDAIETYRATGARQIVPLAYAALAEHHLAMGNLESAQFALQQGLGESSETGVAAVFLPRLYRLCDNPKIGFPAANRSHNRPQNDGVGMIGPTWNSKSTAAKTFQQCK